MAKLSQLKALLEAARAARQKAAPAPEHLPPSRPHATSVKRGLGAKKHADGDIDISHAFADVTRMPPTPRAPIARSRPSTQPRQRQADERAALEASKYGLEPAPQTWDIGQEIEGEQTFLRRGLGTDVLTGLRRGRWVVQAELDLHGMTTTEAHDALVDFLVEARSRGLRCVRVIHGKGKGSGPRGPVLKTAVNMILRKTAPVLAFTSVRRVDGGTGAINVLLSNPVAR